MRFFGLAQCNDLNLMKRFLGLILIIIIFLPAAFSQFSEEKKSSTVFDPSKLRFGGNFWVYFGKETFLDVSPQVGYAFTERFTPGIGLIFQYYKSTLNSSFPDETILFYGGSALASYKLVQDLSEYIPVGPGSIVARVEYNVINMQIDGYNYGGLVYPTQNILIQRFLVGGGISKKLGNHLSTNILILWDLVDDQRSPYRNPVFQIGFSF